MNNQLKGLSHLYRDYFFTSGLSYESELKAIAPQITDVPLAFNHVSNTRKNYSSIVISINGMIHRTRQSIIKDIESKYEIVNSKFEISNQTCTDLFSMLLAKSCSGSQIQSFLDTIINNIKNGVKGQINEVVSSYEEIIFSGYVPFFLISKLANEFVNCAYSSTDKDSYFCLLRVSLKVHWTTKCVFTFSDFSQKEQLYQVNYVNLIQDSFTELEKTFLAFNTKITTNLLQKVDLDLLQAYHDTLLLQC